MICPCCNNQNVVEFFEAYKISSNAWTSSTYRCTDFFHSPLFCNGCGHIFNSSPPSPKNLERYYLDQNPNIIEDYDTSKRISIIEEINQDITKKRLLDFGGSSRLNFHSELEKRGYSVSIKDIGDGYNEITYNVICSYFVFEHLIDLDAVVSEFKARLAAGGKIIIEVPDASLYDIDYSGLLFEHQHHFQNSSLKALMARYGFEEIFSSHELCSRNFGFVSVFQEGFCPNYSFPIDLSVREKYIAGRAEQLRLNEYIYKFFNDKLKQKKILFFWGANANLEKILELEVSKDNECIVIDMNPNKRLLIENLGYKFFLPSEFFEAYSDILGGRSISSDETSVVITATAHSQSISNQLDKINCNYLTFDPIGTNVD